MENLSQNISDSLGGKYYIEEPLAQGGMGKVYRGRDQNDVPVVIKRVLLPANCNAQELIERFRREYYFLNIVDHPHLVKVYDFISQGTMFFLIMEYIHGITLKTLIEDQAYSISIIDQLALANQISRAVEYINGVGILHRDIKPDNIIINLEKKQAKLLDFGLAKSLKEKLPKMTQAGMIIGTPAYTSPEQVNGNTSQYSDVFSLALTLYQFFLWLPKSPFIAESQLHTWFNVLNKQLPPLYKQLDKKQTEFKRLHREISDILDNGLIKDPQKRISAGKMAEQFALTYNNLSSTINTSWQTTQEIRLPQDCKSLISSDLKNIRFKYSRPQIKKKSLSRIFIVLLFMALLTISFAVLGVNSYDPARQLNLGKELYRQKKYQQALTTFNKLISKNSKYAVAYCERGLLHLELEKYQQAKLDFAKAISLKRDFKLAKFYHQLCSFIDGLPIITAIDYDNSILNELTAKIAQFPQDIRLYRQRAFLHLCHTRLQETQSDIQKALSLDHNDQNSHLLQGWNYYYLKDYKQAEKSFAIALEKSIQTNVYCHRSVFFYCQQKYSQARADIDLVLNKNQQYINGHLWSAYIYITKGYYPKALAALNQAITINPNNEYIYIWRAYLYIKQKKWAKAQEDYNYAININQNNEMIYILRAGYFEKLKKTQQALKDLTKVIEITNNSVGYAYSQRGLFYSRQKQYQQAEQDLTRGIEISPQYSELYALRATLYQKQMRYKRAQHDYDKAILLSPNHSKFYYSRAIIYQLKNSDQKALKDLNKSIELDPQNSHPYAARAKIYIKQNLYKKAKQDCNRAIELAPRSTDGYIQRGNLYKQQGFSVKAEQDFNKAIEINSQDPYPYSQRAQIYLVWLNYAKAYQDLNKVIQLNPKDSAGYGQRAEFYLTQKQFAKALKDINVVIKLGPKGSVGYKQKGDFLLLQERYQTARKLYDQAIELSEQPQTLCLHVGDQFLRKREGHIADNYYKRANRLGVPIEEICLHKGRVFHYQRKNLTTAFYFYSRAITANPQYYEVYRERALAYEIQDKFLAGLEECNKLLKIKPDFAMGHYLRGVLSIKAVKNSNAKIFREQCSQAIVCFSKAIELMPSLNHAYLERSRASVYIKKYQRALNDLNYYMKLIPYPSSHHYLERAGIYTELKNYRQAIDDYSKAISIKPSEGAYLKRSTIYKKIGELEKARADIEEVKKLWSTKNQKK